jgi:Fe-S cluster assembly protein SufD
MPQTIKPIVINQLITSNIKKRYIAKDGEIYHINLIDITHKHTDTNIDINLNNKASCSIHIYVLSDNFNKNIKIHIKHASYTSSNTVVKAFASNKGNIKLDLINATPKNTTNIIQNQSIDGILFDETAKITVTPSMLIDTNVVKASHAVNIGNINPEQLFYLMSRGLTKTKATMMILNGMFNHLRNQQSVQDLYNKVTFVLQQMIKASHENKNK